MGLQLKSLARLVEADVAVGAKAQQLQVDAAHAVDDLVVLFAGIRSIGVGAVGQMDGLGADVDLVKQVLVHKAPIAFGVLLGQAAVLVQIDGGDLREIQVALVVPVHQLSVCATGVPPVARPSTQLGFIMTCAEMMLAALRDISL